MPQTKPLEGTIQPDSSPESRKEENHSSLNAPKVGEDGKPTQRAITTAKQAYSVAKNCKEKARTGRIATAAIIMDKYNGGAPFNANDLSKTGQAWRNNFSTNFLASIIDRVTPQMLDPINKAEQLTHSSLTARYDDAATKSRKFCDVTTRVIRRWPRWRDFVSQLSKENVLYGNAVPSWIDNPNEWRPRFWRYDEAFLPDNADQHASLIPFAVFEQKMMLCDFIQLFQDKAAAEKACYNVENCIKEANKAIRKTTGSEEETALQIEDRIRQGSNLADSYDTEARTVNMYHVLVRDYTGGVDLWTVSQDDGTELRACQDIHERMDDALTLFTFQSGNNKYYGSKGLGRLLTNLHIAIERLRNLSADQMYLAGLVIFKTNQKDLSTLQARVRHPFIFVSNDVEVITEQIEFDVQAFEVMDAKLTQLAESIAGAFIPPNLNQEGANTKIEAAQNAERELAVKEGVLGRFFDHLADLIGAMQRKIYNSVNLREGKRAFEKKQERQEKGVRVIMRRAWKLLKDAFGKDAKVEADIEEDIGIADEDAVGAVIELLEEGLTEEEIAILAQSPAAVSSATDGITKDMQTVQYIQTNRMNPFIDQKAATVMEANIAVGESRAKQLVITGDDPQVEAIAVRQQLIELSEMLDGVAMPVAGSDKHDTHRKVLAAKMEGILQAIQQSPTPETIGVAKLALQHYSGHVQLDTLMPDDQKKQEMQGVQEDLKFVEMAENQLNKLAEQAAAAGVAGGPNGMPGALPPGAVGPDGQPLGPDGLPQRQSIHPDDAKLKLEVAKVGQKDRELDQEDQRIALAHDDAQHSKAMDLMKLQQGNAAMVQTAAQDIGADAQAQADRDLSLVIEQQRQQNVPPKM